MLKTMSLKIIHHLICQCKNLNNKCERLSLLMFILHQEGSFFYCLFFTACSLCFWNSHIQLIAFCSAQILLSSYTCSFLRLLICKSVRMAATNASNLQKHQQFVCLSDSLRKQSTIGTQGAIEQQNVIIYNFVQRA